MFAKVFSQIFESSIAEKPELRFTFMDMLVLADVNGVVNKTHEAIARITNRPLTVIKETIAELEGPDPRSQSPDYKGARIKRLDDHRDWGWFIVNYKHYRQIASEEQRREKTLARVKRHRDKAKEEGEADAEGKTLTSVTGALHDDFFPSNNLPKPLNTREMGDAWDNWQMHKKQRGETMGPLAVTKCLNKLKAMGPERAVAAIEHSIASNYAGVYEPREQQRNQQVAKKNKIDWSKVTEENAI
jgi:hypothetical protein